MEPHKARELGNQINILQSKLQVLKNEYFRHRDDVENADNIMERIHEIENAIDDLNRPFLKLKGGNHG